ncbi:carboxylesterase family protein [Aminobacter anthyllidis]|uniref:carboxylesterase/lipase family protein n=1 Tax=Aminobacter anthyllidis TaxID=1035067 RepID=UPI002457FF6B|nr:carboxylesterase family protein [Aminobacter anthyllidis]MDH4986673.1 carboxylesterase family protein [Aminobacter anthyllidis]
MEILVETSAGRLAGRRHDGVDHFLGIPYAAAPVGAFRLRSPRPAPNWTGMRPADHVGAAAPQHLAGSQTWLNEPIARMDEDCLTLNVWAPADAVEAPVLVWFHGGATRNGHGGAAACDGFRLAREHGIVVVTVNYRLGPLGGLAHPDLADPETGTCANWGLQDKIASLRWVRESISAFGGDRCKVTIAGQSSGAANVVLIAQNPDCRSLFRAVIAQSPPLFQPPMFVGLDTAAEYTEAVAASLGTSVAGLRDLDGTDLVRREAALLRDADFARRFPRPRTAPTLDGALVHAWPHDGVLADVPLLIGFTRDEARFWYDLALPDGTRLSALSPPGAGAPVDAALARRIALHYPFEPAPSPAAILADYRAAMPKAGSDALWLAIYSDLVFRAPILRCAARHARRGPPVFLYDFAWPLAVTGGTPHAACVPFVFGTHRHLHLAAKIGANDADGLSGVMMAAWAAFVRDGTPATPTLDWPALNPGLPADTSAAMTMDGNGMLFGPLYGAARLASWPAIGILDGAD